MRSSSMRRNIKSKRSLFLETLETRRVFTAGDLDTTFGTGGLVRLVNSPAQVQTYQAAGSLFVGNGTANIAKLSSTGAAVSAFGNAGIAIAGNENLGVQSTGMVVTAVTDFNDVTSLDAVVRRLTVTGTPDLTFGTSNGEIALDFLSGIAAPGTGANVYDYPADLEINPSTNAVWVLVHGDLANDSAFLSDHFAGIARLTAAGQLDTSFGVGGKRVIEVPADDGYLATDLLLTTDGGAVVAGVYTTGGVSTAVIYKLTAAGAVDTTFGTAGKATVTGLGEVGTLSQVLITRDPTSNKFIVGGYSAETGTENFHLRLARLTATGGADNYGATASVDIGHSETTGTLQEGFGLAVQADGKAVVAFGGPTWNVKRIKTDGTDDTAFGQSGLVTTSLSSTAGSTAQPMHVMIQQDGQIVVSGMFTPASGVSAPQELVVARYAAADPATGAPSSSVSALAATTFTNELTVQWSGTPVAGSTITGYDVYYTVQGQSPVLWQSNTAAVSAKLTLNEARRKTISFYSVARDSLGRVETAPSSPDTQTNYVGAPWQNPVDRFDVVVGGTDTGEIGPIDILNVIFEFNSHSVSSRATSEFTLPPIVPYENGPYYDVDGDNLISPSDILLVIFRYNQIAAGGESPAAGSLVAPAAAFASTAVAPASTTVAVAKPSAAVAPQGETDLLTQLAIAILSAKNKDEE